MPAGNPYVFGVRHLSPMGAWQLRCFLDEVKPKLVLIEGLPDAEPLIGDLVRKGTRPPVAILAYTDAPPVETLLYPMATYSPEYQALLWAKQNRAESRFIDLPSDVFLALNKEGGRPAPDEDGEPEGLRRGEIYQRFADRFDEPDYETYWERNFEHNTAPDAYRRAAFELGAGLREFDGDSERGRAENLIREAHMRRCIRQAIDEEGVPADKIVCVVGAFHAPVLGADHPAMSDDELASLPRLGSKLTLMPYSYFRLSSQSGYGAGNQAPAYFEMVWRALESGTTGDLAARYLSRVARRLRKEGTSRSAAEVIEGVRLANTLSALKGGVAPTLIDLHDAATTLIGHGERSTVADAIARVDVGTAIGELPDGVSQTSIQEDFERALKALKLTDYKSPVQRELTLDLRENRSVKSEDAAFLDLRRSSFLHRLQLLGVSFAKKKPIAQDAATWKEVWALQWSPESEIELVEAVLLGETVELATAFKFANELADCASIAKAATAVRQAIECDLPAATEQARRRVQELGTETSDFVALAHAAFELASIVRYGDVRRFDPEPLLPLLEELFVQGALSLSDAANCDNDAAKSALEAIDQLDRVALDHHERVDEPLWERELSDLAAADHLNPLLSGFACAILLERNLVSDEELAREVSRRLSPGIEADLGAGWFEGLSKRNRYALLSRLSLWRQLADYIASLDKAEFTRALVFLRRAFGEFSPTEKRSIAENLGQIWGVGADEASEVLSGDLSEEETEKLDELNDFDFDDL